MALKDSLIRIAPILASGLGGPLAGAAVTMAADALGLSEKTEQAVQRALSVASPEQLDALRKADYDFAIRQQELDNALEQLMVSDRANARQREIATQDHITPRALAAAIVLGFFGVIGLMIFQELPATGRDSLLVLVGALGAAFGGIVQYYFGSSTGSHNKQRQLDALRGRQ